MKATAWVRALKTSRLATDSAFTIGVVEIAITPKVGVARSDASHRAIVCEDEDSVLLEQRAEKENQFKNGRRHKNVKQALRRIAFRRTIDGRHRSRPHNLTAARVPKRTNLANNGHNSSFCRGRV